MSTTFNKFSFLALFSILLLACGGGSGGTSDSDTDPSSTEMVEISGRVTYDRITFSSPLNAGLDYSNIQALPARGVSVELVDPGDIVQFVTKTDENGHYRFLVQSNQDVRVRVIAELNKNTAPAWDIQVRDNTTVDTGGLGALYTLDGSLASSGVENSVRNLHAASGWDLGSSNYTSTRAAAPFAILDTLYDAVEVIGAVDGQARLPDLDVFWSPDNVTIRGSIENGEIGSGFFRINMDNGNNEIFLLGQQNVDTDEFDAHLILHEWAHFLEQTQSRADTPGGGHNIVESQDMRLALSEGFANAFSAIASQNSVYRDSFGVAQNEGFSFDVEANPDPSSGDNAGWFVESSIHSVIYDLVDEVDDGSDSISLGLEPIYNMLIDPNYIDQNSFTSIFSFSEFLKLAPNVNDTAVDNLLAAQNITGSDRYGTGEANDGGFINNLPVYSQLTVDGPAVTVCSTNSLNSGPLETNKLGNRRYIRFTTDAADHTITVSTDLANSDFTPANPAYVLYRRGQTEVRVPEPGTPDFTVDNDSVSQSRALGGFSTPADEFILEVFSRINVDDNTLTGGDVCFNVTVTH
jgi:hypothetical protein